MIKVIILIQLFFTNMLVYSQNNNFNYIIRESFGDLNQDGLVDRVIISMDTVSKTRPLIFQIFFTEPSGTSNLFFSSTQIIEPMYPIIKKEGYSFSQIPDVDIIDGKLQIDFYIKGNSSYYFKYKNGNFELNHLTYVNWDTETITETEFNLLTGKHTKQTEVLSTGEVTTKIEKKVILNPLPQLKNFKPFENGLF